MRDDDLNQRDFARQLLLSTGYDRDAFVSAYAQADKRRDVPRLSRGLSSEAYAQQIWLDGHRPRNHGFWTSADNVG